MAPKANFNKVFKDKFKEQKSQFIETVKDKKDEITDQLKENPFEIIPIDQFVSFVDDPIGALEAKFTDREFIGDVISTAISCVPYVGPILSSIFGHFWGAGAEKDTTINEEKLEERLKEFKQELLSIVDSKIEQAQKEIWTKLVENIYNCLLDRLNNINEEIAILQSDLKEGKSSESTKEAIRVAFTEIGFNAKQLLRFCNSSSVELDEYKRTKTSMEALFILNSTLVQINALWYQLEMNPKRLMGIPADGKLPAVKSMKHKHHDIIVENLKYILLNSTPVIYCFSRSEDNRIRNSASNNSGKPFYEENVYKLLNTDTWLYPVKLKIADIKMDENQMDRMTFEKIYPEISIPSLEGSFIYRIDPCISQNITWNTYYSDKVETEDEWESSKKIKIHKDPLTKCKGIFSQVGIDIKFPKKRNVIIRILGQYSNVKNIILKSNRDDDKKSELLDPVTIPYHLPYQELLISSQNNSFLEGLITGFTQSQKYKQVDELKLFISFNVEDQEKECVAYFKFIELIITDL